MNSFTNEQYTFSHYTEEHEIMLILLVDMGSCTDNVCRQYTHSLALFPLMIPQEWFTPSNIKWFVYRNIT